LVFEVTAWGINIASGYNEPHLLGQNRDKCVICDEALERLTRLQESASKTAFCSPRNLKHGSRVGQEASLFWEEVAISIRVFKDVKTFKNVQAEHPRE
jgi:hypothetical protein